MGGLLLWKRRGRGKCLIQQKFLSDEDQWRRVSMLMQLVERILMKTGKARSSVEYALSNFRINSLNSGIELSSFVYPPSSPDIGVHLPSIWPRMKGVPSNTIWRIIVGPILEVLQKPYCLYCDGEWSSLSIYLTLVPHSLKTLET